MISVTLARHLKDARVTCNRLFQEARLRFPHLDAERFSFFLEHLADPLVCKIEAFNPQGSRQVAIAAYRHGLELVGLNWIGAGNPKQLIKAWQDHLADMVIAYIDHAEEVFVCIAHALHQLEAYPGTNASQWLNRMADMRADCSSFQEWKRVGQVLAWQAGLAHYRDSALAIAAQLPESLALKAVGAPAAARWVQVAVAFQRNPWWTPANTNVLSLQSHDDIASTSSTIWVLLPCKI